MAVDYSKYIDSSSIHYISNSGHDENGKYNSGAAGDQTGNEWELRKWYNRPWTVILRHPKAKVRELIAKYAIDAALNKNIGYDQYQRTTYWYALKESDYDPAKVNKKCEADCTAGVTANVKAVGHVLGIKTLEDISPSTYSGNMKAKFVAAGFTAITQKKYLTGYSYLLPGDILLYEGHHAATNVTRGKSAVEPTEPTIGTATGYVNVCNGSFYIRTHPDKRAMAIGSASNGDKLVYLGITENGWYKVYYKDSTGWISSKAGNVTDVAIRTLTIKPGNWWIRAGIGTDAKIITNVTGGNIVKAYSDPQNGWYLIEYNNQNGYISERAIEK